MALSLSASSWSYLVALVIFTLACLAIAIPGLVAPIQIQPPEIDRRGLPERSATGEGNRRTNFGRERNRDAQKRLLGTISTERTKFSSTDEEDNSVTNMRTTKMVPAQSENVARTSTSPNLILPSPKSVDDSGEMITEFARTRTELSNTLEGVDGDSNIRTSEFASLSDDASLWLSMDEYYTYDYDDFLEDNDEEEEEEDEEYDDYINVPSVERSKKDAGRVETDQWRSLQKLAELATMVNPDLGFVNLITPNPDLDITIEVVTDNDDGDADGTQTQAENRLPSNNKPSRPPSAEGTKGRGGKGRKDGSKPKGNNGGKTRKTDNTGGRIGDTTSGRTAGDDESYNLHLRLYHLMRQMEYPDEDGGESSNLNYGEWSEWSACSAPCGGGKTQRSRQCGSNCRTTESHDCNTHPCSDLPVAADDDQNSPSESPSTTPMGRVTDGNPLAHDLDATDFDSCEEWMQCRSEKLMSYLSRLQDLPSCPCIYPTNIRINDSILDRNMRKVFRWVDLDPERARLDIYKPTAKHCIQSLIPTHSTSLASQQCCYDNGQRLITRGQGAGTPQLISTEISQALNYKIDILPWIICKGDWTKYNKVRPPNNGGDCPENPDLREFLSQIDDARNF